MAAQLHWQTPWLLHRRDWKLLSSLIQFHLKLSTDEDRFSAHLTDKVKDAFKQYIITIVSLWSQFHGNLILGVVHAGTVWEWHNGSMKIHPPPKQLTIRWIEATNWMTCSDANECIVKKAFLMNTIGTKPLAPNIYTDLHYSWRVSLRLWSECTVSLWRLMS